MADKHVANRETEYVAINSAPDMCLVSEDGGEKVVAFDIYQRLTSDKAEYSTKVFARKQPVLMINSIVGGVIGNAGRGVKSGVSLGKGHVRIEDGAPGVFAEKRRLARHLDPVEMNGKG